MDDEVETTDRADGDDEDRGIECPRCGCRHLPVVYTRPTRNARRLRVRRCRHCGRRITTYEEVAG